jgi:tape measure domain-containing protein
MADALKEAIRLVIETEGREGIDALRKALGAVGDVSADTVADTDRLLDSLVELNATAAKATSFQALSEELEKTTQALDHASREAIQFGLELAETEKPSKKMQAEYRALREEVTRLEAVQKKQATAQEAVGRELREAGVDATKLATAERTLRTNVEGVTTALQKQVGVIDAEVAATRKQKQATADADEAFRKFVQSGTASAEALKKVEAGTKGAAAGSRELANEGGRLRGMFDGLRGLIGPVLAYLSFSTAIQGIKNLAGVGAAAEDARRALVNLYGSTEAGNRAYEGLRDMARQSGLAFADLVADAKKLKAFGLDPLNGSLQALIDQNASVGGSQQDLSGKVLALGQAWAKQKLQGEEILQLVERGVPVWDLLQKSTGKNVQELQKLSEQGKLGREVIKGLYEELGRANSGAAERGLSSLSGLLSQARARWEAFLQAVADNGVTDYLKQRIQSLLGSTSSLDALAKRVADGVIGMLEALRNLGTQLAPIGAAVGGLTLFLARHAESVLNVIKAWALFRAIEIAAGFGKITQSIIASTTALVAQNAALAATSSAGAAVGGLSGLFAALSARVAATALAAVQLVRVLGIPAAVITGVVALTKAYEGVAEANLKLWQSQAAQRSQQQDQLRLGQQLQQLYQSSAAIAVQSGDAVSKMTRAQAQDYQFALEQARLYYRGVVNEAVATGDAMKLAGARERMQEIGAAIDGVKSRLEELNAAATRQSGIEAFVNTAVAKFDELAVKAGGAKEAVSGIFDGLDMSRAEGVRQASEILEQVGARGKAAGEAVRAELSTALSKVAQQDLPAVKAAADAAMAAGQAGARSFADAVAQVNLQRLGVDINAIKTGFTEVGRSAVDAFRGAILEVDKLGLTVEQRSRAIAQAFDNAFKQASTKAELQALKAAIIDALSAGDIGFAEFSERVDQVDAKLAEVGGTGQRMGTEVAAGAGQASSALGNMAGAAAAAASSVEQAGDAAAGADKATGGYGNTASGVAITTRKLSDAALEAYLSCNKLSIGLIGISSRRFAEGVNRVTEAVERQGKALDARIAQLEREAEQMDENYGLLQELRQQYHYLAEEEIQRLFQAEVRLKELREQSAASASSSVQAQLDAYAALSEAATEAADAQEAAAAGGLTQGSNGLTTRSTPAASSTSQSTPAATTGSSDASASAGSNEVVLRVVTESSSGAQVTLTYAQLQEIASAVVRIINQSRSVSA